MKRKFARITSLKLTVCLLAGGLACQSVRAEEPAAPVQAEENVQKPEETLQKAIKDLSLFAEGQAWEFEKNTGEGSYTLGTDADGTRIGILQYDFTNTVAQGTPYVLATTSVEILEGPTVLQLKVRSEIPRPHTFRIVDSTGQTLQFKTKLKGGSEWETVRIPLDRKLEHWDGANDGKVHFPITQISFSVPRPAADANVGKVEYSAVVTE
jgi:hypothetical protein